MTRPSQVRIGRNPSERGSETEMSKAVIYKGYTIQPALRQLPDTGQWELNVFISWSTEEEEDCRHFYLVGRYATEDEATAHCIAHGQQIVDGKIPGSSVG
ncbi:MAG: hypothetical protein CAF45_014605 [Nitrospira sp. CG24E]|nr:MAG: hypothetical protein CAF45_014605 [Nitrospira sp. CG24E]